MAAPLLTKLCFAAALIVSIALAYLGPPPRRGSRAMVVILAVIAGGWYLLALVAVLDDRGPVWIAGLLAAGVETTCGAAWMARYRPDPEPEETEDEPDAPGDQPYAPLWAGIREPGESGSRLWHDE